jgi:hypothetical protein
MEGLGLAHSFHCMCCARFAEAHSLQLPFGTSFFPSYYSATHLNRISVLGKLPKM